MKYQHRVLGLLALLSVITYLDRVCIAFAGPRMQDSLNISPKAWGWVTGIFFLSYGAFEIPSGALGDRIGPRRVLTRIVLWWSAFTSLTGMVSNYVLLLIVRFAFGMGEAGAYPNAAAVIARWIPPARRARAWGVVWMTAQVGAAFAPLLVLPLQARFGWRAAFFVFGAAGVIWAAVWHAWFRDSPAERAGITDAELRELGSSQPPQHTSLPWRRALASIELWRICGIAFSYVYVQAFFLAWLPTYLVRGRGFADAGLMLSSMAYVVGAGANISGGVASDWLVQRLGLRRGRRTLGVFGLSVAASFMAAAALTANGGLALAFLSVSYAGILLQQPNTSAVVLDVGRSHTGALFGFMNTAGAVGSTLSSISFGYVMEYFGNYNAPLVPMVGMLCLGALLWAYIDPTRQLLAEEVEVPGELEAAGV